MNLLQAREVPFSPPSDRYSVTECSVRLTQLSMQFDLRQSWRFDKPLAHVIANICVPRPSDNALIRSWRLQIVRRQART